MGQYCPTEKPRSCWTSGVPLGQFLPTLFLLPPLSGPPSASSAQMVQDPSWVVATLCTAANQLGEARLLPIRLAPEVEGKGGGL